MPYSRVASSSSTTLQDRHLANLSFILRRANYRYQQVADNLRQTISPTQHARLRARSLGLTVNIDAAVNLDQRFVSHLPLPVISTSPVPAISHHLAVQDVNAVRYVPKIVVPAPNSDRRIGQQVVHVESMGTSSHWSPSPVEAPNDAMVDEFYRKEADVPMDIQSADEENDSDSTCSNSSVSTADDSCGPITPENMMPTNMRIKRKSSEMYIVEKRAKFEI